MPPPRLTSGSYAVLGLLAIQPWSTYELAKLFGRSVQFVMPRTEANRYQEPKRLVAAGLATARIAMQGRRRRTIYSITPAGQEALRKWLEAPARPTQLESEGLLKILFGNVAPVATMLEQLRAFEAEAEAVEVPWRSIAREYAEGDGPFPERIHINALFWALLDRWARLRAEWARWAAREVESWPDQSGPRDRSAVQEMLRAMLDEPESRFPERPSAKRGARAARSSASRASRQPASDP